MTENTVCEACLSVDRKISKVNGEILKIYSSFLDADYSNELVQLCWECAALLRKVLRLKHQVKTAHSILIQYLTPKYGLPTLSNLKITKCTTVKDITHEPQHVLQPLTFVKIEDEIYPDLVDDNQEDIIINYDDGPFSNNMDEFDDNEKGSKIDIKSDPILEVTPSKKKKSRKKTKTRDEFNDSDNEPLKSCSDRDAAKPRGRRKKNNDSTTSDGRKVSRRREKPAGVVHNARVHKKLQQLNVDSEQLEMVVLSWEEVEAERQRALASEAFTRHEYRCGHCALGFNHRCKLEDHMKKHDPSFGAAQCGVCQVRCRDARALAAHRRRHRVRWRCRWCGEAWSRAAVAADHVAREHGGPTPTHVCSVCGQRETSLGKLRNHIKNHSERQKCELCGKTFRDRTSLRTHLFIHRGEKEYACPRCDKRFLFKKAMEIHLVTHDASAHLYCHQCDMNFKNQMSFNQHIKYNLKHVDPAMLKYACQLCDKRFVKAARLEEHNLAVHLKVTPISCAVPGCHFACSSRPVLRTHVRMLHRNARAKRDHVCDVCGKAYMTKKSLEGHLRSHSGERPFRCAACPAAFGYEAALYNHNKLVHLKPKCGRGRALTHDASRTQQWPAAVPTVPQTDTKS